MGPRIWDAWALAALEANMCSDVTFGVGGTIYRQSMEDMYQLGVSTCTAVITKTLEDIHLYSVTYAINIITQCRILEGQKFQQAHCTQQ